jgi:TfoX/Sxy family transcriptional regulator of competence genes
MPKWTKAPQHLIELFHEVTAEMPGVELRKMFGYPVAFVSGQMFFGLFQDRMMIRLAESDRTAFLQKYKTTLFEPTPGRPMREYAEVPESLICSSAQLIAWLLKSAAYASSLPPKVARKKSAASKRAK